MGVVVGRNSRAEDEGGVMAYTFVATMDLEGELKSKGGSCGLVCL